MDFNIPATLSLTIIATGITAYYARHTKKIADEQMLKQLFKEFNERYDKLNDTLSEVQTKYSTFDDLNQAPNSGELKKKVNDYFSLCAEEFYWYKHKKRIDKLLWESWQTGMNYWYNNVPSIKALWDKEVLVSGKRSYYITDNDEFFIPTRNTKLEVKE